MHVASDQLMRHDLAHNIKLMANRNRNRNLIDGHHALTQRVEVEEVGSSATISGKQRRVEDASIGKEFVLTNTLLGLRYPHLSCLPVSNKDDSSKQTHTKHHLKVKQIDLQKS